MTKVWFRLGKLQMKAGIITDLYGNYVELYCEETKDWYIRPIKEIEIIYVRNT